MARIKAGGPPQHKANTDNRADLVSRLNKTGLSAVDSGTLLSEIIAQFGGVRGFVKELRAEWVSSKPGSLARKSIMETISRLTIVVTSQEIAKPRRAEDMEDDELEEVATGLLVRFQNGKSPASPA